MSYARVTRTVLTCDVCGWQVSTSKDVTEEEMRKLAADKDGWAVEDGRDVCGDVRHEGAIPVVPER